GRAIDPTDGHTLLFGTAHFPQGARRIGCVLADHDDHPVTAFDARAALFLPFATPWLIDCHVDELEGRFLVERLPDHSLFRPLVLNGEANEDAIFRSHPSSLVK